MKMSQMLEISSNNSQLKSTTEEKSWDKNTKSVEEKKADDEKAIQDEINILKSLAGI